MDFSVFGRVLRMYEDVVGMFFFFCFGQLLQLPLIDVWLSFLFLWKS